MTETLRLAILASGRGSNAQAIVKAYEEGRLGNIEPVFIFSDKNAPVIAWAREQRLDHGVLLAKDFQNRLAHEEALIAELQKRKIDLIVLAGYMRILSPDFVKQFPKRILNIHPSILPAYPGIHSIERAYRDKVSYSGVTVHLVDDGVDSGPILAQVRVALTPEMSLDAFEAAIHAVEHRLYPETLVAYANELMARDPSGH